MTRWWKLLLWGILRHSNGPLAWKLPPCINAIDLMKCILGVADECYYFHALKRLPSAKIFRCYLAVPASWAPHSDSCVANGSKAQHNQLSDQRLGEGRAKSMVKTGAARGKNDSMNGILEAWSSDHKRFQTLQNSNVFVDVNVMQDNFLCPYKLFKILTLERVICSFRSHIPLENVTL